MITQIEFDEAALEATAFFADVLVEFQRAYMVGREPQGVPPDAMADQGGPPQAPPQASPQAPADQGY